MRSLRYLNTILTLIAVLLTLNLWTAWTASPGTPAIDGAHTASAQAKGVGSSGERQVEMINQLKSLNTAVGNIETTLTSGKMRVKVDSMPKAE